MRKWMIAGLALLVVIACWQAAAPWMAMDTLRDAAREADQKDLSDAVDFPALRASVKSELKEEIAEQAGDRGIARLLPLVLVDKVVDRVVTPEGLSALLVSGHVLHNGESAAEDKEIDWHVRWTGLNSFRAVPDLGDGKEHPSLIFKRDGFSWNLVGIDIPDHPRRRT